MVDVPFTTRPDSTSFAERIVGSVQDEAAAPMRLMRVLSAVKEKALDRMAARRARAQTRYLDGARW